MRGLEDTDMARGIHSFGFTEKSSLVLWLKTCMYNINFYYLFSDVDLLRGRVQVQQAFKKIYFATFRLRLLWVIDKIDRRLEII